MQCAGCARSTCVSMRLYVRRAASEEDAIEMAQELIDVELGAERRNQEWNGSCAIDYRTDVLLPHGVRGVQGDYVPIGWKPDDGATTRHKNASIRPQLRGFAATASRRVSC